VVLVPIAPEAGALLQSGCALLVGSVDPSGAPHATRGWGLRIVDADRGEVRIVLPADDPITLDNLRTTGRIAVTGVDIESLRSIQVKGRALRVEAPTTTDRHWATRYCDAVFHDIEHVDGTPPALVRLLLPRDYVACVAVMDECYDQTPGPRAGTPVEATPP
jgi:pyridoxamine 5'-phosphate oxidase-like protein